MRQPAPDLSYVLINCPAECVPQSGDIVLIDATSNLDRQDTKLFQLLTCSPAGGLICPFLIRKGGTNAFTLFKEMLPSHAFYKRGQQGPRLFMSDDCASEINMLKNVFPASDLLLCHWH